MALLPGSVVGAQLALGLLDLENPPIPSAIYIDTNAQGSDAFSQVYPLMAQAIQSSTPEIPRQALGRLALEAQTMSEEQAIQRVNFLAGHKWPANFKATTVNVSTGQPVVWDKDSHNRKFQGLQSEIDSLRKA